MGKTAQLVLKVNDLQPYYYARLKDVDGDDVDLSGASIVFSMKNIDSDTLKIDRASASLTNDGTDGKFHYEWQSGDTDTAGIYRIEFEISVSGGKFTVPPDGKAIVVIRSSLDTQ